MTDSKKAPARASKRKSFDMGEATMSSISGLLDESVAVTDDLIQEIQIDDIILDPNQPRRMGISLENPERVTADDPDHEAKIAHLDGLRDLGRNIAAVGLIQPIGVYPASGDSGKYILAFGERRVLASKIAGLKTIRAQVGSQPENLREKQLSENMFRSDPSLAGRLATVMAILDGVADDQVVKLLQERTGWSRATAYRYCNVARGPQDVRDAIEAGALNNLALADKLASIEDDTKRAAEIARVTGVGGKRGGTPRPVTRIRVQTKHPEVARVLVQRLVSPELWEQMKGVDWSDMGVADSLVRQALAIIEREVEAGANTDDEGGEDGDT